METTIAFKTKASISTSLHSSFWLIEPPRQELFYKAVSLQSLILIIPGTTQWLLVLAGWTFVLEKGFQNDILKKVNFE